MKKLILSAAVLAVSFTSMAQVGVGTTTADASAAFEVKSTTQGFLPPRLTKAQLDVLEGTTPTEGLMVYCSDCPGGKGIYVFDGTDFLNVTTGGDSNLQPVEITLTDGTIWMDRDLGASAVGADGDLYQWGRSSDGHELAGSGTTTAKSTTVTATNGLFFITAGTDYDWRDTRIDDSWGTGAVNDPCPTGYHVPTEPELSAVDATGASELNLATAGRRRRDNAVVENTNHGYY